MTAVQLPGEDGTFLATQRMYSPNDCKDASIVLCWHEDGSWKIKTLLEMQGVHRFDVLTRGGIRYLIICTIKSDYDYENDWRFPGKVYACPLPEKMRTLPEDWRLPPEVLREGLLKNHGYSRHFLDDVQSSIVTSENGVFHFTPPASAGLPWEIEQLIAEPVSDALLLDLDGDGQEELLTLSPFHGDTLRILKRMDGRFEPVFVYDKKLPFLHAICAAEMEGRPLAVIGNREGDRDLMAVYYGDGAYRVEVLDHDVGPANVCSFQRNGQTVLLAANREINEIAYYILRNNRETI